MLQIVKNDPFISLRELMLPEVKSFIAGQEGTWLADVDGN